MTHFSLSGHDSASLWVLGSLDGFSGCSSIDKKAHMALLGFAIQYGFPFLPKFGQVECCRDTDGKLVRVVGMLLVSEGEGTVGVVGLDVGDGNMVD
jgi:hypothetical protein